MFLPPPQFLDPLLVVDTIYWILVRKECLILFDILIMFQMSVMTCYKVVKDNRTMPSEEHHSRVKTDSRHTEWGKWRSEKIIVCIILNVD